MKIDDKEIVCWICGEPIRAAEDVKESAPVAMINR